MKYFLGIDSGTSGIKAVVVSETGEMVGTGYQEIGLFTPKPMWAEQDPNDWWNACVYAVKTAVAKSGVGKEIDGIGISGQMLGNVMLDKDLQPIENCMIWLDQRAVAETEWMEKNIYSSCCCNTKRQR